MATYNVCDFGALGDGKTNDALAIQKTIDACTASGGGRVYVPAGKVFYSGTLTLKSNVELFVERGAVITASDKPEDYTFRVSTTALSNGRDDPYTSGYGMLITAIRAQNIAITGGGIIDGGGKHYIDKDDGFIYSMKSWRPYTLFLLGSSNVTIQDVIIRDGALWTVRLSGCEDVLIQGIRIQNDLKLPNNDGIDLDRCRNVRILGCHIVSGDDCICLKTCLETAEWGGPCENIVVSGCTLISTSSALIIGAEARSPMRNVIFDSCVISSSHRGLAIHLSEDSDVENVIFSNMIIETRIFHERWWGRGEPIYITAIPWTAKHNIGHVRRIRFNNILCRSENGVFVYGWTPGLIEELLFENVRLEVEKWSRWPGGRQDIRPSPGDGLIEMPTHGFFLKNVKDVTLRNCQVIWGVNPPDYYQYALATQNVDGLVLENFKGESAHPKRFPAILQE